MVCRGPCGGLLVGWLVSQLGLGLLSIQSSLIACWVLAAIILMPTHVRLHSPAVSIGMIESHLALF